MYLQFTLINAFWLRSSSIYEPSDPPIRLDLRVVLRVLEVRVVLVGKVCMVVELLAHMAGLVVFLGFLEDLELRVCQDVLVFREYLRLLGVLEDSNYHKNHHRCCPLLQLQLMDLRQLRNRIQLDGLCGFRDQLGCFSIELLRTICL